MPAKSAGRALLLKIGAACLADQVHANHPLQSFQAAKAKGRTLTHHVRRGALLDAKTTPQGVIIASDFTLTAILASQDRDRVPARDRYNAYPPPPPPNGQDYGQGNDQGYGPDYDPRDNQDQPPYDGNRPYRQ